MADEADEDEADAGAGTRARAGTAFVLLRALFEDPEHGRLPALLLALTLLSGVIDAVCLLSLGKVFVANMTGNLVFIGPALIGVSGFSLTTSAYSLCGFVLGVEACRALARGRAPGARAALLRDGVAIQSVLLIAAAAVCAAVGGHPDGLERSALIVVCAVAMGLQNGTARRMEIGDMTTAVMTGTLIGLVGNLGVPGHRRSLARQAVSIAALILGALVGAAIVRAAGPTPALFTDAALALAVAGSAAVLVRRGLPQA